MGMVGLTEILLIAGAVILPCLGILLLAAIVVVVVLIVRKNRKKVN